MTDSEKLDLILSRLDKTNEEIAETNRRIDVTNEQLAETNRRIDVTNEQLVETNRRIDATNERLDRMSEKVDELEKEITEIKLILENEIRVNIRRVAEGHFSLSKNLHEALMIGREKEMLAIRVNVLESEIRRIKAQLEIA